MTHNEFFECYINKLGFDNMARFLYPHHSHMGIYEIVRYIFKLTILINVAYFVHLVSTGNGPCSYIVSFLGTVAIVNSLKILGTYVNFKVA